MKRAALGLALAVAASPAWTAPAAAQVDTYTDSDVLNATAIVAAAIDVVWVADLDFGTVLPNYGRTINFTDGTAGHFQINGAVGAEVMLTFTVLPAALAGSGANTLPVTFTALFNNDGDPSAGTAFDPATSVNGNLDASTGQLHVFVGGTVTAASNQAADNYSSQVELTAAYTGS